MALTADTIYWARPRVQNFSDKNASKLIAALVSLDGRAFDKIRFFETLIAKGVVSEPAIPAGMTRDEVYRKRWDSYLAGIRPFGLGFNVLEQRVRSPSPPRTIWRVSDIAWLYDKGDFEHEQFVALQLARTQLPNVTMPLKPDPSAQYTAGANIQPLRLFIEVTDALRTAGDPPHLTLDEIAQLPRCHTHADVNDVVAEIQSHRGGGATPNWKTTDPSGIDILVNDLNETWYFRRLKTSTRTEPLIVPNVAALDEARDLVAAVGWIDVTTDAGIEAYYERLISGPSDLESEILNRDEPAVVLDAGEYTLNGDQLSGPVDAVGGLHEDNDVYLRDEGRLYRVAVPAERSAFSGGQPSCTATISLIAFTP